MKTAPRSLALLLCAFAPIPTEKMTAKDSVRVREFYRLAAQIQDQIWPGWGGAPAPLLLVTSKNEFLTHAAGTPEGFEDAGDGWFVRARQFPANFQATFPAFGPPSVIVVGTPENTASKTSTPWVIMLMHEHFHQLQDGRPGAFELVEQLGLSHGDKTGMWMLDYPFPYEKAEVAAGFRNMRDTLLSALRAANDEKFKALAAQYLQKRKEFFGLLASDDRKYFNFQLWKEGIARYTEVKAAEAASSYQPTAEFTALPDYTSFVEYGRYYRQLTLKELTETSFAESKRVSFYSFGAAEGFLLDRLHPDWKQQYFRHPFTLDEFFEK
jgi:hypothetical protein